MWAKYPLYVNVNSRRFVQFECNAYWATAVTEMGCNNKSLIVSFGTGDLQEPGTSWEHKSKGQLFYIFLLNIDLLGNARS